MNDEQYEMDNNENDVVCETAVDDNTNDYLSAINNNIVIGIIIISFLLSVIVGIISVNFYKNLWKR